MKGTLTITDKFGNMVRLVDVDRSHLDRIVLERVEPGSAKSIVWHPAPVLFEVRWVDPTKRNKKMLHALEHDYEPS